MVIDLKKSGKIAIFTINRPEKRNAMTTQAVQELSDAMVEFRDDPSLWVGVVTGAGKEAFCGGADVDDRVPFMKAHRYSPWAIPPTPMRGLTMWKPLIAAINGLALGGGLELALACDLRIASENARFGTPEVKLGLIPGWGGTQRLPRTVPWCKAAEMVLMGRIIDAQEAFRVGLVNKVVTPDEVMPVAMEWAESVCQLAPLAVRAAKEAMTRGSSSTLEEGLALEQSFGAYLLGTGDFAEGLASFTEKRKPVYEAK